MRVGSVLTCTRAFNGAIYRAFTLCWPVFPLLLHLAKRRHMASSKITVLPSCDIHQQLNFIRPNLRLWRWSYLNRSGLEYGYRVNRLLSRIEWIPFPINSERFSGKKKCQPETTILSSPPYVSRNDIDWISLKNSNGKTLCCAPNWKWMVVRRTHATVAHYDYVPFFAKFSRSWCAKNLKIGCYLGRGDAWSTRDTIGKGSW